MSISIERKIIDAAKKVAIFDNPILADFSDMNIFIDNLYPSGRTSFFLISPIKENAAIANVTGMLKSTYNVEMLGLRKHLFHGEKDFEAADIMNEVRVEMLSFASALCKIFETAGVQSPTLIGQSSYRRTDANVIAYSVTLTFEIYTNINPCLANCIEKLC